MISEAAVAWLKRGAVATSLTKRLERKGANAISMLTRIRSAPASAPKTDAPGTTLEVQAGPLNHSTEVLA